MKTNSILSSMLQESTLFQKLESMLTMTVRCGNMSSLHVDITQSVSMDTIRTEEVLTNGMMKKSTEKLI